MQCLTVTYSNPLWTSTPEFTPTSHWMWLFLPFTASPSHRPLLFLLLFYIPYMKLCSSCLCLAFCQIIHKGMIMSPYNSIITIKVKHLIHKWKANWYSGDETENIYFFPKIWACHRSPKLQEWLKMSEILVYKMTGNTLTMFLLVLRILACFIWQEV